LAERHPCSSTASFLYQTFSWELKGTLQMVVGYRSMVHAAGSEGGKGAKGFVEEALNSGRAGQENLGFISVVRLMPTL
jgi:hypothetical protein